MALPLAYSLRNLWVRRVSTGFTALGVAMTVAVFAGVLALRDGFRAAYDAGGRDDTAIYLRPGATSEGVSGISRGNVEILTKERPEIALGADGRPLAAAETFLAVYMELVDGGVTNVPLRGIQPASLEIYGEALSLSEGRWPAWGSDEVVVGEPLTGRMRNCEVGATITLNTTPFRVVGVYQMDGAQGGEVWGDVDRMMEALQRPFFQRVIAKTVADVDLAAVSAALESDPRTPAKVLSERDYMAAQTVALSGALEGIAFFLTLFMGVGAVLGSLNTMIAAIAARTHEVGVLLALGYGRFAVFAAFLIEASLIGLAGGLLGLLVILPLEGTETGAMNWNTFTDVSFRFDLTPALAAKSFALAFALGVFGGVIPALRAARLRPVAALRSL